LRSPAGTTRTSLDARFRVALGERADIERVLTNSKSKRSCELANRERVGETRAPVWDPLDPCILHMGPVAVGSGLVWDPRETQVPLWDPLVSKLVPDETHAVLSSAVAAALGHEF
jgi:hypothetical protein